jgi:hypothetical protein
VRTTFVRFVCGAALAVLASGCGDVARQGRGPSQIVIDALEAASGADPENVGNTLNSDVITIVERQVGSETFQVPTVFNDLGQVTMSLILKNPGTAENPTTPSTINQVTFTRYRVTYRRADGRNQPGVDVPYDFDGAMTITVPPSGSVTGNFTLVRHTAKEEAPLRALTTNGVLISTIAEITFYGRDQAGNEVSASGSILVVFGNFGDPE